MIVSRTRFFAMGTRAPVNMALIGPMLLLSACSAGEAGRICEAAGGHYTGEVCDVSSPAREAARNWCETHGGIYLAGQEHCAFGGGGP